MPFLLTFTFDPKCRFYENKKKKTFIYAKPWTSLAVNVLFYSNKLYECICCCPWPKTGYLWSLSLSPPLLWLALASWFVLVCCTSAESISILKLIDQIDSEEIKSHSFIWMELFHPWMENKWCHLNFPPRKLNVEFKTILNMSICMCGQVQHVFIRSKHALHTASNPFLTIMRETIWSMRKICLVWQCVNGSYTFTTVTMANKTQLCIHCLVKFLMHCDLQECIQAHGILTPIWPTICRSEVWCAGVCCGTFGE